MLLDLPQYQTHPNNPKDRLTEIANQLATQISNQLSGIQGTLLKPMLTNYLNLLTTQLTNESSLNLCDTLQGYIDYVMYGDNRSQAEGNNHV